MESTGKSLHSIHLKEGNEYVLSEPVNKNIIKTNRKLIPSNLLNWKKGKSLEKQRRISKEPLEIYSSGNLMEKKSSLRKS